MNRLKEVKVISAIGDFTNFLKMYGNLSMAIAYTNSYRNIDLFLTKNLRIIISNYNFSGGNAADTKRATNQKSFIRQD